MGNDILLTDFVGILDAHKETDDLQPQKHRARVPNTLRKNPQRCTRSKH